MKIVRLKKRLNKKLAKGNGLRSEVRRCSGVDSTRVVGDDDGDDGSIDHCRYRSIGDDDDDGGGGGCPGRTQPTMALARGRVPRH
ncbi:hypothetical protein PV325_009754 [Microctonus aethiopoides]|nr:hypothetical protein PV325_009754 [Microctonus aethiopoides]